MVDKRLSGMDIKMQNHISDGLKLTTLWGVMERLLFQMLCLQETGIMSFICTSKQSFVRVLDG